LNSPSHSSNHATVNDEVAAIAAKVGINSSTDSTSIDFKLNHKVKRVVLMADGSSITPTGDTADINTQINTQAGGTLAVAAPSGTPLSGQTLILRIKSTNSQTFSWDAIYRGSAYIPLPTTHTGASKTNYYGFIYNADDTVWDLVADVEGF